MIRPVETRRVLFLLLALLAVVPAGASAQSASEIMADFRAEYERRMEGIENYTVVQNVLGNESTVYFVRKEVGGIPVFEPQMEMGGTQVPTEGAGVDQTFFLRPDVAERFTYEGSEEVDGHRCHVVRLDDFTGLEAAQQEGFDMESMSFCLDTEAYVPRRMRLDGASTVQGEARPMSTTAVFKDYREVGGMLHPYRVEMTIGGMGMSGEQQSQMQAAMAQMEKQLEQLPEAQRERMRAMMESRMEGMRGVMGAASGEPMVIETTEVKINAGPPGGGDR